MDLDGEFFTSTERVLVSPASGVFVPLDRLSATVEAGATIGLIRSADTDVPLISPVGGEVVSIDAVAGQRIMVHERVGWMRSLSA
ncbi:MAG: hypothetical protein ACXIVQ_13925 [Acidimicrobiales bacterium]